MASILFILLAVTVASMDQRNITAKPGENVTLPCGTAEKQHVVVVNWKRTDQGSEYVLLYRDQQLDSDCQSASFKNRVGLKAVDHRDPSLILRNVTTNDNGTYECWVAYKDGNESRAIQSKELISTINLTVEAADKDKGQDKKAKADEENKTWQIVGYVAAAVATVVVAAAVVAAAVVAVFKCRRRQRSLRPDANPPVEEHQHMISEV